MKGKWAQGIEPRNFTWIIRERLAVCERPGGYGHNHRRVRRQEEIIWVRENGFDLVVSLSPSPHNLHNYDELGVRWCHLPYAGLSDGAEAMLVVFQTLTEALDAGQQVLVHREELGDFVCGLVAGYLRYTGLIEAGPDVIVAMEQLISRPLGPVGRELVGDAESLIGTDR